MLDTNFFLFFIELFLATILVVYLKLADNWAIEAKIKIERGGAEIVQTLKELREDLAKLNKILNFIKNFRASKIRKLFFKTIDVINLILLFYPGGKKSTKLTRFFGLKFFKAIFLALKGV